MSDTKPTRIIGGVDLKALAASVTGTVNSDVPGRIRIVIDGEVDIDVVDKYSGKTYINVTPTAATETVGTLTAGDLAVLLNSTPERVRAALRDLELGVGSGHRYNLAGLPPQTLQAIHERLR